MIRYILLLLLFIRLAWGQDCTAPDGSMLWGDDGVSVSNSSQTNYSPRLAVLPDNSVVVAWSPNSTTVEIQRISSDGGLMWGDGILIEDNIESLMSPQPIVNSNGDALVQWIGQSGPVWAADSKIPSLCRIGIILL